MAWQLHDGRQGAADVDVVTVCCSLCRPGVFYTIKMDGCLDVWDYFYKQNEPTLQVSAVSRSLPGRRRMVPYAQIKGMLQAGASCAAMRHIHAEHLLQAAAHICSDDLHVAGTGKDSQLCSACTGSGGGACARYTAQGGALLADVRQHATE